ncbi:ABC transporter substrate-binding protein [bacterium]|nr:ABC transporter substrate-binding protein [bacterium]
MLLELALKRAKALTFNTMIKKTRNNWPLILIALVVFFSGSVTAQTNNKPQRIVSLGVCTDQVLLQLVEPERIAAVTYLSADPTYSYYVKETKNITLHHNLAEEIVPLNADLIIGPTYSANNATVMLEALDQPLIRIKSPTTFSEVESFVQTIGQAVGEVDKAQQLIAAMKQELQQAKNKASHLPNELAISYAPNGFTAGKNTLKNEILIAAGFRNLAAELGIEYYGNLSVEQLLHANPDVIIIDEALPNQDSLAQRYTSHPALYRLLGEKSAFSLPTNLWLCPGLLASKAVTALVDQR